MGDRIKIKKTELLSDDYNPLKRVTLDYKKKDGKWEEQIREVYDKDSGSTILLYNTEKGTVILTKQFRIPIYINEENHDGMAIEACAGLLEGMSPRDTAIKETLEETGYQIADVQYLFEAYMVPGTVTEKVYFFKATYDKSQKVTEGGGLEEEHEEIEVLELSFSDEMLTPKIRRGANINL